MIAVVAAVSSNETIQLHGDEKLLLMRPIPSQALIIDLTILLPRRWKVQVHLLMTQKKILRPHCSYSSLSSTYDCSSICSSHIYYRSRCCTSVSIQVWGTLPPGWTQ